MPLSVTWATKVINVPQSYLTPLGGSLYELDVNQFRKDLRALEAGDEGISFLDAHRHITETVIGGFTYARLIEIINGYTVTFEDLQYGVNSIGANHNIADVLNRNQVSLLTQNSAGLVASPEIEFSSFDDAVTVDIDNVTGKAKSGIGFPTGTRRQPVDNFLDALALIAERGFDRIRVIGNATLTGLDFSGLTIEGQSEARTTLTIDATATVPSCEFEEATIGGTFDGDAVLRRCITLNCSMVKGLVENCRVRGTFSLNGTSVDQFSLINCVDDLAGLGTPTIDCGGDGPAIIVRGFRGGLAMSNKSGASDISIDGTFRLVLLTGFGGSGDLLVRGPGPDIDNQANFPAGQITNQLLNPDNIWAHLLVSSLPVTSAGFRLLITERAAAGRVKMDFTPDPPQVVIYDDNGTSELRRLDLTAQITPVLAQANVQTERVPV